MVSAEQCCSEMKKLLAGWTCVDSLSGEEGQTSVTPRHSL